MSEFIRHPAPDWKKPFTFPYLRDGQNPLLVKVEPRLKDYRLSCDGLVLTGTELASLIFASFGLSCKEVARRIDRTDRRVRIALEQAKNRNHLASRDELIAKAEELGILTSAFLGRLEEAADKQ